MGTLFDARHLAVRFFLDNEFETDGADTNVVTVSYAAHKVIDDAYGEHCQLVDETELPALMAEAIEYNPKPSDQLSFDLSMFSVSSWGEIVYYCLIDTLTFLTKRRLEKFELDWQKIERMKSEKLASL